MVPPSKKLDDLIRLAELCVDLLQQNEEHYAEVSLIKMKLIIPILLLQFYATLHYAVRANGTDVIQCPASFLTGR